MPKTRSIYIGPIAVGYLPKAPLSDFESQFGQRLWSPLQDDATHHWVPNGPCSSPTLTTIARYDDGARGSYVLETSSEAEVVLFEADFQKEIEILKLKYDRLEVIFGVISY